MDRRTKKAIMGIGTLIIFIATILVAAVAAGVLISTSGVLQQRALIAGQDVRKRLTNAVEIISVLAEGNASSETINNFEIYLRLSEGSDPLQMRKFDIQYITGDHDAAASLQHKSVWGEPHAIGQVTNSSYTTIGDFDQDGYTDYVILLTPNGSTNAMPDVLSFNISSYGVSDDIPLYEDLSNITPSANATLDVRNEPLTYSGNAIAFVNVVGNSSINNTIPAAVDFNISNSSTVCSFKNLRPENYYCYVTMHGNDDTVLDFGERLKLLYKLYPNNSIGVTKEFRFIFSAEAGRLSEIRAHTPDVITTRKVPLWPID
ncbi:hypothetical protein JXB02_00015 [Candidatus Woesearchaeota archaeon]|nr:hypothetical protein [Candidatus Woesearchaeota archaeon]